MYTQFIYAQMDTTKTPPHQPVCTKFSDTESFALYFEPGRFEAAGDSIKA